MSIGSLRSSLSQSGDVAACSSSYSGQPLEPPKTKAYNVLSNLAEFPSHVVASICGTTRNQRGDCAPLMRGWSKLLDDEQFIRGLVVGVDGVTGFNKQISLSVFFDRIAVSLLSQYLLNLVSKKVDFLSEIIAEIKESGFFRCLVGLGVALTGVNAFVKSANLDVLMIISLFSMLGFLGFKLRQVCAEPRNNFYAFESVKISKSVVSILGTSENFILQCMKKKHNTKLANIYKQYVARGNNKNREKKDVLIGFHRQYLSSEQLKSEAECYTDPSSDSGIVPEALKKALFSMSKDFIDLYNNGAIPAGFVSRCFTGTRDMQGLSSLWRGGDEKKAQKRYSMFINRGRDIVDSETVSISGPQLFMACYSLQHLLYTSTYNVFCLRYSYEILSACLLIMNKVEALGDAGKELLDIFKYQLESNVQKELNWGQENLRSFLEEKSKQVNIKDSNLCVRTLEEALRDYSCSEQLPVPSQPKQKIKTRGISNISLGSLNQYFRKRVNYWASGQDSMSKADQIEKIHETQQQPVDIGEERQKTEALKEIDMSINVPFKLTLTIEKHTVVFNLNSICSNSPMVLGELNKLENETRDDLLTKMQEASTIKGFCSPDHSCFKFLAGSPKLAKIKKHIEDYFPNIKPPTNTRELKLVEYKTNTQLRIIGCLLGNSIILLEVVANKQKFDRALRGWGKF